MSIIVFQTGRQYTAQGQRIAAMRAANGDILFVDGDREIEGVIPVDAVRRYNVALEKDDIMRVYDGSGTTVEYWIGTQEHDDALHCLRHIAKQYKEVA